MGGLVKLTVCVGVLLLICYAVSPPLLATYGRRIYGKLPRISPAGATSNAVCNQTHHTPEGSKSSYGTVYGHLQPLN